MYWCACALLFSGVWSVSPPVPDQLSLSGTWTLSSHDGALVLPAEVPGCVHSALLREGLIQDPYFRFNDVSYRWIALENWTYSTTFTASAQLRGKQEVELVFDGVDTVASITLNGNLVGKTDNMFRRYDFSIRELLKEADNLLQVQFLSPVVYASERSRAHQSYRVPPECPPDVQKGECHVNFIRKEQSSFSWDWGPSFPTVGLWRSVRLEAFDTLQLQQLSYLPLYNGSGSQWELQVELLVDAVRTTGVQVAFSMSELDLEQAFQTQFLSGRTKKTFTFHIKKNSQVKLWWPSGHGDQPFYMLSVRVFGDGFLMLNRDVKQVFFRTVELIQEPIPGSPGLLSIITASTIIKTKGCQLESPGSTHAFQNRSPPCHLKNLLRSAVDANMNALRVWGGGVYEQDLFYDMCDDMGIMVWQDFMFACAMYPTEADFIQTVREEVVQQVGRLKSHPSIIIWSGNNENEAALATNWFNISTPQRPVYVKDYVTLYVDNIRKIVLKEDPSRPFLVSSPTNGVESEREGLLGLDHVPWTRFASEYGFQSWPSFSTLQPVSVKEDWSFGSNFSSHRQHHENGNQQMLQQAALHFHLPNSTDPLRRFTDTLYITQVMQAQCVKAQTEFYRSSRSQIVGGKGHTMGALYWQLNDIWPAPSWSSLEFGGKWKMLHYFARSFFAPLLPVSVEDDGALVIYAVSDLNVDLKLRVVVTVHSWANLDPVCSRTSDLQVVPGSSAVALYKQPVAALLAGCGRCTRLTCLLTFHLEDGAGSQRGSDNYHFLSSPREAVGLQRANITVKVQQDGAGFSVTLQSSSVAAFVWLDVGNIPGRFSSNGFLMLSRNKTVGFEAWRPTSAAELSRSLTVTTLRDVY
ncbi:hypothetical protein OJAV_G00210580 [Oryzias javanicus]|uniref:Beta-mannosidase n=1 Tax=Oryzias javanicus TaxID=123683 RepID=A0A3S2TW96_ORYJA|nr:hypothetical protein OJAV_G00210580 [Oryzias javanicus]